MSHTAGVILAVIVMLPGILGLLLPLIPGVPYMFVVALVFGAINQFAQLTGQELVILAAVAVLSIIVDYTAGLVGARWGGASRMALRNGLIGLIAGLLILPPFGGLIGMFIGVGVTEYLTFQNKERAVKAASGSLLGATAGIAINLLLAISFIVVFIIFALR